MEFSMGVLRGSGGPKRTMMWKGRIFDIGPEWDAGRGFIIYRERGAT
jgi:hypothetical protein